VVRQIAEAGQATNCQILFLEARQKKLSPDVAWIGVLTVGESAGFAAGGGVIGFKLVEGRVRLEINVAAAELRKLHISSKLLSLAHIVKTRGT
jgi:YfiR/HmsC-like